MMTAPARREVVREMKSLGLTERRALVAVGMSASSLRYEPAADRNVDLRQTIISLAQRYRRYSAEMIYLKMRQGGRYRRGSRISSASATSTMPYWVAAHCRFQPWNGI